MFIQNEYSIKGKKRQVSVLLSLITNLLHDEFFFRKKWTVMKSMEWNLWNIQFVFSTKYMHNIRLFNCCHFILCLYLYLSISTRHRGTSWTESLENAINWVSESSPFSAGACASGNSLDIQICSLTEINALAEIFFLKGAILLMSVC